MQSEAEEWILESADNLATARILYQNERFKDTAYYCHQVVEKALKAVQIKKEGKFDKIHDLVKLAQNVGAQRGIILNCEKLTKYYIPTKYPVSKREIPTEKDVEACLSEAEEVLEWAKSILKL